MLNALKTWCANRGINLILLYTRWTVDHRRNATLFDRRALLWDWGFREEEKNLWFHPLVDLAVDPTCDECWNSLLERGAYINHIFVHPSSILPPEDQL